MGICCDKDAKVHPEQEIVQRNEVNDVQVVQNSAPLPLEANTTEEDALEQQRLIEPVVGEENINEDALSDDEEPQSDLKKIFVSYSSSYRAEDVRQMAHYIKSQNFDVWPDVDRANGDNIFQQIAKGISKADLVVIFFSEFYPKEGSSSYRELEFATRKKKKLLLVRLQRDYVPDDDFSLMVGNVLWVDYFNTTDSTVDGKEICRQIRLLLGMEEVKDEKPNEPLSHGFESMNVPFIPSRKYFQRKEEERKIWQHIVEACNEPGVLVISGEHGIGKSTLVSRLFSQEVQDTFFDPDDPSLEKPTVVFWINCVQWRDLHEWDYKARHHFSDSLVECAKSFDASFLSQNPADIATHFDDKKGMHVLFVLDHVLHASVLQHFVDTLTNLCVSCCVLADEAIIPEFWHVATLRDVIRVKWSDEEIHAYLANFLNMKNRLSEKKLAVLAKRCLGLPLIASTIRAQFRDDEDHDWEAEYLKIMAMLKHVHDELDSSTQEKQEKTLTLLFEHKFHQLETDQRHSYYAFLFFDPGETFSVDDIKVLWGPTVLSGEMLKMFERMSLVHSIEGYRFVLHDMLFEAALQSATRELHLEGNRSERIQALRNSSGELAIFEAVKKRNFAMLKRIVNVMSVHSSAHVFKGHTSLHLSDDGKIYLHHLYHIWCSSNAEITNDVAPFVILKTVLKRMLDYLNHDELLQLLNSGPSEQFEDQTPPYHSSFLVDLFDDENCETQNEQRKGLIEMLENWRWLYDEEEAKRQQKAEQHGSHVEGETSSSVTEQIVNDEKKISEAPTEETAAQPSVSDQVSIKEQPAEKQDDSASSTVDRDFVGIKLMTAAKDGDLHKVISICEKHGADIVLWQDNDGWTPMMVAAQNGHQGVVEHLFLHNSHAITVRSNNGETPLMVAAQHGHLSVVEFLFRRQHQAADQEDNLADTPLMYAAANDHLRVVKFLCEEDPKTVQKKNSKNMTALQLAIENDHSEVADYLKAIEAEQLSHHHHHSHHNHHHHHQAKDDDKIIDSEPPVQEKIDLIDQVIHSPIPAAVGEEKQVDHAEQWNEVLANEHPAEDAVFPDTVSYASRDVLADVDHSENELRQTVLEEPQEIQHEEHHNPELGEDEKETVSLHEVHKLPTNENEDGKSQTSRVITEEAKEDILKTEHHSPAHQSLDQAVHEPDVEANEDTKSHIPKAEVSSISKDSADEPPSGAERTAANVESDVLKPDVEAIHEAMSDAKSEIISAQHSVTESELVTPRVEVYPEAKSQIPEAYAIEYPKQANLRTIVEQIEGEAELENELQTTSKNGLSNAEKDVDELREAINGKLRDGHELEVNQASEELRQVKESTESQVPRSLLVLQASKEAVEVTSLQGTNDLQEESSVVAEENQRRLEILKQELANVRQTKDDLPVLMREISKGNIDAIKSQIAKDPVTVLEADRNGWTPLMMAAQTGNLAVAELLCSANSATVSQHNKRNRTPLMIAAQNGRLEMVKLLAAKDTALCLSGDKDGVTPVMYAALQGHANVVEYLASLDKAALSQKSLNGTTPVMYAALKGHVNVVQEIFEKDMTFAMDQDNDGWTPVMYAALRGKKEVVELLAGKDPLMLAQKNQHGRTSLMIAAQNGHLEVAKFICEILPESMEERSSRGWSAVAYAVLARHIQLIDFFCDQGIEHSASALLYASLKGDIEIVEHLCERYPGAIVAQGPDGWSALMAAAQNGHEDVVKMLLEKDGKCGGLQNKDGRTALMIAAQHGHRKVVKLLFKKDPSTMWFRDSQEWTPLMYAALVGKLEVVDYICRKHEVSVTMKNAKGETALTLAALKGHLKVVMCLCNKNADTISWQDKDGWTPLMAAAQNGHQGVVEYLYGRNADGVLVQNSHGRTSVMMAAQNGHLGVVEFLGQKNAKALSQKDNYGDTPLMYAALKGHLRVVKFLCEKEPKVVSKRDKQGSTALALAAENGHYDVVDFLRAQTKTAHKKAK